MATEIDDSPLANMGPASRLSLAPMSFDNEKYAGDLSQPIAPKICGTLVLGVVLFVVMTFWSKSGHAQSAYRVAAGRSSVI